MFDADVLKKLLWARPGPVCEQSLEMRRAELDVFRDLRQARLSLKTRLNVLNRFRNTLKICLFLCVHGARVKIAVW